MSKTARTAVSVVVPTKDRPQHAVECVTGMIAAGGFAEVIVVDQSDDDATEKAVGALHEPRLRYVRTSTRGVTNSRNIGIEVSTSEVIAFTDDDCRVRPDWVARI